MSKKCKFIPVVDTEIGDVCFVRPDKIEAIDIKNHVIRFTDWSMQLNELSMMTICSHLNIEYQPRNLLGPKFEENSNDQS